MNNKNKYFLKKNGREVVGTRASTAVGSWNCLTNLFPEYNKLSHKKLEEQGFSLRKDRE